MSKTASLSPEAFIAIGKNRQRIYGDNLVYLSDGQEFSIELYNPTSQVVGAKIYMNGEAISNSLIVLRPAQRYFLDRYLDSARKFKFSTYEAEGESKEQLERAIQSNGLMRVEFFGEIVRPPVYVPYTPQPYWYGDNNHTGNPITWQTFTTNGITGSSDTVISSNLYFSSIDNASSGTMSYTNDTNLDGMLRNRKSTRSIVDHDAEMEKVETGRVETGSASSQSFESYSGEFQPFAMSTTQYKLMPESTKPTESVRAFCGKCNARKKKSEWTFCPNCGGKF